MLRHIMLWLAFESALGGCARPSAIEHAQSLVRQHREDEALATLEERLRTHPDDQPARRLLVRVLASTGDMPRARTQVEELAKRLPPGDPTPLLELGHALELVHRYDDALDAYDRAAAVAPRSPAGPREGGMRCARWGEADEAAPRLLEAVRRGARDAETWHTLGLVRVRLGDYDGAVEAYRAGAAADPRGAENWLGLATVAVARGDPTAALAAYDEIVARKPAFAAGQLGRAWALSQLGRKGDAQRAIDRAEELGAPPAAIAKQRAFVGAQPGKL
ncbi:MAG: tetratricopeptide repeat protein [Polyangiaceae bacterium]